MAASDFSIRDVLQWARTKPADEAYDYIGLCSPCALDQFLIATGRSQTPDVSPDCWYDGKVRHDLDPLFDAAAQGLGDYDRPDRWTFGAFARRLEALLPAEPKTNWLTPETYLSAACGEYVA